MQAAVKTKYFSICRYGFSSNTQDLCKNAANTDSVNEGNDFLLCKLISC